MKNGDVSSRQRQDYFVYNILERITDGFYALDNDWNILYWNKEAEKMLGKSKEEVLGKNIWESFPDGVQLNFYSLYHQALKEQKAIRFEGYYPPKDVWAEVNVYPSASGLSVYFKNINERKKSEEEIKLLSLIAKETVNAVSIANLDGTISWINNAFTKLSGYGFDEVVGKKHSDLLSGPESDPLVMEEMHRRFYKRVAFTGEILVYAKSQQKIWFSVSAQPIFDAAGSAERFFFIQTDITEQKRLRQELDIQQKKTTTAIIEAQEKERAIIGRELHDNVNQVLTSVKLYNELCLSDNTCTHQLLTKSIGLIQCSIDEIRNLSQRLSAPSLGNIKLKNSIADLVKKIADTRKFSVHVDDRSLDKLEVGHDVHLGIYRILQEHLVNVLKHAEATKVDISFKTCDGNIMFKVIDNGIGFDTKAKSAGIGISNMRSRAENLMGSFTINSKPGLGCVIIVQIPLNPGNN